MKYFAAVGAGVRKVPLGSKFSSGETGRWKLLPPGFVLLSHRAPGETIVASS